MELEAAGLAEQPFRTHDKPLSTVSYASHRDALQVLEDTCAATNGLSLLQAPTLSGKSTLIRHFIETRPDDCAIAIVNGDGLNTTSLLESVLRQFGYVLDYSSPNELLAMLRVFTLQQAASGESPLLIIENAHALNPSAFRAVCELADLQVRRVSALKIVLVSDRSLHAIVAAPAMECIAKRLTHDFHLRPMTHDETVQYLHAKLTAAGSLAPEFVFPAPVCSELWRASGGWPGILDRIALLALARAQTLPVPLDEIERPTLPNGTWDEKTLAEAEAAQESRNPAGPPMLYVSHDGNILKELTFHFPRLLVGRSEHNDIAIPSRFISRHHALLVRHGSSTLLMDLNSANGTFVNSKRISNHVLLNDDLITIGHHSIKFSDTHATKRGSLEGAEFADTTVMKTLEDMRKLLAQVNSELLPTATEVLPTAEQDTANSLANRTSPESFP
jgi:general secretion pathway protein A